MRGSIVRLLAKLKPYQRSLLSGGVGFVFYGAWAYWVNSEHGSLVAIKAACVQGSYSFALTFVMTLLIEALYLAFFSLLNNYLLIIWMTIGITCVVIFSASWWVNVVAETPEIFKTVILGYVVGGIYSIVYVYGLARTKNINKSSKTFNGH